MSTHQLVDHFFRTEYGKVVTHLANRFGAIHLELAEDCVQEALMKAMKTWPYTRIPNNPSGWIMKVATNSMIDQLRRTQKHSHEKAPEQLNEPQETFFQETLADEMIKMLFACCHPSLSDEQKIILTLKILGGLSIREIASALIKKEEAIAKAYTRAKKKFKTAEIQLALPPAHEIEARLDMVLKIIYLLFNEGYKTAEGQRLINEGLTNEAIRLSELLLESELCNTPASNALIALMLLHSARFHARTNKSGELVTLEHQDRSKWNQTKITQAMTYLDIASQTEEMNEYLIQAAISATHCKAETYERTDWSNILKLYDLQLRINPSPIVSLNRIVPLVKVKGPITGLIEIERLEATQFFEDYYLFFAIKAEVLEQLGNIEACKEVLQKAIHLVKNEQEKTLLIKRLSELD